MPAQDVTHFTSVDHTADPGFFIHFLEEGNKQPAAIVWRSSILDGLGLKPGMKVLDIGCGLGDDAVEFAALVVPSGHVTGVDLSQLLITVAVRRFADRGPPFEFEVGDVQTLRFADESFDAVREERVPMHIPDPLAAVAEMRRVLRPGGRMATLDLNWETQFCGSPYNTRKQRAKSHFLFATASRTVGSDEVFREVPITEISTAIRTVTVTDDFLQFFLSGHVA